MGMAASQARFLSLTGRLHDNEFKAQSIMAEKIALATQKEDLYQDYCDALDATKIQVAFSTNNGNSEFVDANFNTLCNYSKNRYMQYALKDNRTNNIIVSQDVKNTYESFGKDAYTFAFAMMGLNVFDSKDSYQGFDIGIGTSQVDYGIPSDTGTGFSLYMTECEQKVYDNKKYSDDRLVDLYTKIEAAETDADKKPALKEFRNYLYNKYSGDIFNNMYNAKEKTSGTEDLGYTTDDWSEMKDQFVYYTQLWSAINEAGGCQVIDPIYESGKEGNEWLNNVVNSGLVTIQVYTPTGTNKGWSDTSVTVSTNQNYLQENQDESNLKKIEAQYEHELDIINKKDARYDTELSKLETERSAISTEMESLKKVIDENSERSFGIFS